MLNFGIKTEGQQTFWGRGPDEPQTNLLRPGLVNKVKWLTILSSEKFALAHLIVTSYLHLKAHERKHGTFNILFKVVLRPTPPIVTFILIFPNFTKNVVMLLD